MIFCDKCNEAYFRVLSQARQAIESTYDCLFDIVEYIPINDVTNKRTKYEETVVLENKPCRLSYKSISNSNQGEEVNDVTQVIKLFIAPEIRIKPRFKDCCY